jgi:hypothetical protein
MERDKANELNRFYLPQFLHPTHSIWYGVSVDPRLMQFNLTFLPFLKLLNAVQTGVNVEYASMENNG